MKYVVIFAAIFACLLAFAVAVDKEACSLPKEVGPCRKAAHNFYYNQESKQCEEFIYGGCRGNDNRFKTKDECEKTCVESEPAKE